jgi:hypothetical protein
VALTKALRETNAETRCQHFSFIFHKNKLITIGKNSKKSNPTNIKNPKINQEGKRIKNKYTCSELHAFIKFKNMTNIPFGKVNLVVTRIDRNGRIRGSKPCTSCQNLLNFLNLKEIYYTVDSDKDSQFEKF